MRGTTHGPYERGRSTDNNFDAIRLIAAISVLASHAVAIGEGRPGDQPLLAWSHQMTLGEIGVAVFLIVSGYLVTASAERRDPKSFLVARCLRIFPGLAVVVLATILLLGPVITTDPRYWTDVRTPAYALNILFIGVPNLPGVFSENGFGPIANGSLWTLGYEFTFYIVLLSSVLFGLWDTKRIAIALIGVGVLTLIVPEAPPLVRLGLFFLGGALAYRLRHQLPRSRAAAGMAFVIVVVAGALGAGLPFALATAGSYLVIMLATLPGHHIRAAKYGDFSYGIYLTAFPIQQAITHAAGGRMAWWANLIIALPLSVASAALLWHGVEKRALRRVRPDRSMGLAGRHGPARVLAHSDGWHRSPSGSVAVEQSEQQVVGPDVR